MFSLENEIAEQTGIIKSDHILGILDRIDLTMDERLAEVRREHPDVTISDADGPLGFRFEVKVPSL